MSQLLLRLERQLELATQPEDRSELLARKACALCRLGRKAEALELIRELREQHGDWSSGLTHVWIMLAEGLTNWYSNLNPQALDRLTRAQVLSIAMRYDTVAAISSAWKAHIEFEVSDFDAMFRSLRLTAKHAKAGNNDASARFAIVLCNVFWLCGNWAGAAKWFAEGRKAALAEGDLASIEALQYNRAALAITWVRAQKFAYPTEQDAETVAAARREINSSRNFQAIANIETLTNYLRLCDARLQVVEGKYAAALAEIRKASEGAPFGAFHFNELLGSLEIAYCLYKQGEIEEARDALGRADFATLIDLDIDDRFVAVSMLSEMGEVAPGVKSAESLERQRNELRDAYFHSREKLASDLAAFCDDASNLILTP